MSWMRLASGFAFCVFSAWCCDDAEFTKVMQQNEQLQRAVTELLQKLEALQMEELNRRMEESDVACCPCNVTVGHTTVGPPLNPFWQVTSGECQLEDDCLTSPNYPEDYDVNQACEINITDEWVGYLDVQHFETEEYFDFLIVNDVEYSGTLLHPLFDGVIPNGTIFWSSDYVSTDPGFKICRTSVPVTTTHAPDKQSYNEFWGVTEGDCDMDTSGCIASPNYPEEYGSNHVCLIELTDLWEGASIGVNDFRTESYFDYLLVNNVGYSGDELDSRELQGMVPTTTIVWSADYVARKKGGRSVEKPPHQWSGPTGRVPCSVMTVPGLSTTSTRTHLAVHYTRTQRTTMVMTCCMTGTHGALRPMNIAMTSGSRVDHAVVLREKHRPTTVAFFMITGTITATSSALRAFLGRSSPSVATALPISAPPAAAESIPAPTEPRPATRAKQVALPQQLGQHSVQCALLDGTRRRKEVLRVRRALQVASVTQSVQIRACLVSQVVTVPMPAARGARTATSAASQMSRACPCATFAMMF